MNQGKIFENAIKASVPDGVFIYRLPDAAQSFAKSSNLRFSRKNPCDYFIYDAHKTRILFALELKTVKGKSISFERNKEEQKTIHYHQITGLTEWNKFENIVCGFLIEFRAIETTIFLDISDFNRLLEETEKKSFTIADLDNMGLPYLVIPQELKRTRYSYDLSPLLNIKGEQNLEEKTEV